MAYALHLPTLDSVLAAFADTHDGGIRQAANTLQVGTQHDIRNLCRMWGVKLHKRTELGIWRKRRGGDIEDELTVKVLERANALYLRYIRDLCSMWGVKPDERNESGKRRKRRDEDLVAELTAKVMRRAQALHEANRGSNSQAAEEGCHRTMCVIL